MMIGLRYSDCGVNLSGDVYTELFLCYFLLVFLFLLFFFLSERLHCWVRM